MKIKLKEKKALNLEKKAIKKVKELCKIVDKLFILDVGFACMVYDEVKNIFEND